MKIVTIQELMKLPQGTIFSEYEPVMCSGLYRKVQNCDYEDSIDFMYQVLEPQCDNCEPPVVDNIPSRWGRFDAEEQFAVYEPEDIATLKGMLP